MAHRWLRIRVELVAGRGEALTASPGRVMLVPPGATFEELGLGIDLAFGRWDVTRRRSFRPEPTGRHESGRAASGAAEIAGTRIVHEAVLRGSRFEYVFDDDAKWVHACLVEEYVPRSRTQGRPPIAVPISGWGTIPDQDGRTEPFAATGAPPDRSDTSGGGGSTTPEAPATTKKRRRSAVAGPLDLSAVRRATAAGEAVMLLSAVEGRDLSAALQQVGDALSRAYRSPGHEVALQQRIATALRGVEDLLRQRDWEGDDVLADEIDALVTGSERRGRTLQVDLGELAEVMSSGGDDPGGYLHLDTGEVVHAFLRHGAEYDEDVEDFEDVLTDDDDLWIYIDHDPEESWRDMAAFAAAAPNDLRGILTVAIQGKGAFARFRRTVDELGLWSDWQVFSDDRQWGRARAVLRSQGIRPV